MMFMRLFHILFFISLLSSCNHTQNDYRSLSAIDSDLKDSLRSINNIATEGIIISYYGYDGWSEPDFRFNITRDKNGSLSAKYIHLNEGINIQAKRMWSNGVRNSDIAHDLLDADLFNGNESLCNGLATFYEDTWAKVVREAVNFKAETANEVKNDGGSNYTFHLSNGNYKILSYVIDDKYHQLVQQLVIYLNEFKHCAKKS